MIKLLILLALSFDCHAAIRNPSEFIGEVVFGSITGAPLSADTNGKLVSGISNNSAYNDSNFTCTTTDQVITGVSIAAPPAGNYLISMSGDINSTNAGTVVTLHFQSNNSSTTHGQLKTMPFAGGTLSSGSQRIPFSKTIITTLNGTNALEVWCSTSANTVTTANVSLVYERLL
jgi:hypothetical protein